MRFLSQGTISLLVGCHSPVHSIMVIRAWRRLYGKWPGWKETLCILFHDVGHIGLDYLDDPKQKQVHWVLGAQICGMLFGQEGFLLAAGHSRKSGFPRSKIHDADKMSWSIAPVPWLALNAFFEKKLQRPGRSCWQSAVDFKRIATENFQQGFPRGSHDIYLEDWEGKETT